MLCISADLLCDLLRMLPEHPFRCLSQGSRPDPLCQNLRTIQGQSPSPTARPLVLQHGKQSRGSTRCLKHWFYIEVPVEFRIWGASVLPWGVEPANWSPGSTPHSSTDVPQPVKHKAWDISIKKPVKKKAENCADQNYHVLVILVRMVSGWWTKPSSKVHLRRQRSGKIT